MTRSRATAKQADRIVVACINWPHPDAPHAMTYMLRDGEMIAESFHRTWAEAMVRADNLATAFRKVLKA